ncbi:hypothetical protein GS597_14615 [Synechococcales cyanobacterium C]|uniref:histidine kinase n=1 Tax=Petrachloros mirabilis ULC683 TaxID=2781853 RepID=A0A8K2A8Z7_9CYAN|nr:hypothetical protein [Petrachloros mirabilis ULC683]
MSSEHTTLADFVQKTWTLAATTSLAETLQIVQQWQIHTPDAPSTDRVVVVDAQQKAFGLLSIAQLLAKVCLADRQTHHQEPIQILAQGLLHPIWPLSVNLTPLEVWHQWQVLPDVTELTWGVIHPDSEEFLGLLDLSRLQQSFTAVELGYPATNSHQIATWTPQVLNALVGLFEQLPTPLLLQTTRGEVITRNLAWRQQVDPMISPSQIAQTNPQTFSPASPHFWGRCHRGDLPNSLVCTYSLQDGQEQIWQFHKVPVALLNPTETSHSPRQLEDGSISEISSVAPESTELWITQAQDVTDTHHLVPELEAKNADLMLLNSLNEDFLAELSHDIKTPLTALVGLSNVLQEKRLGTLSQRQTKYLQLIYQKSQQLLLIMNDLLDLTQIRTQRLMLHPETVEIESLCQDAITQALRRHSLEQGTPHPPDLVIPVNIDPELTDVVADPSRLRQSLVLLLCQSLGLITASDQIGLQVKNWGRWVAWTVWDTGMGIPSAQQHLIFQTPVVFEASPTKLYQTRLGFILARRLAQLQGGDVTFLSTPQQPNHMTLLLPAKLPQAISQNADPGNACLVLVIAAMPALITELHQILGELDAQLVVARSGPEALEKSRQLLPQLIFLHLPLPYISGWDVLTLLKRDTITRSIPVVIIGDVPDFQRTRLEISESLSLPLQPEAVQGSLRRLGLITTAASESAQHPSASVSEMAGTKGLESTLDPESAMTILHLEDLTSPQDQSAWHHEAQVSHYLHRQGCRVIAATDIEQAELLATIWRPQVVLYTSPHPQLIATLERHSPLSQLPFVVLHTEVIQQLDPSLRLNVFLVPLAEGWEHASTRASANLLLETVKAAADLLTLQSQE